jgi:hypothetical protein
MNLFGFLHRERAHRQLRRDHAELLAAHKALKSERADLRENHDEVIEARDYFKGRYMAEHKRAEAAEGRAIDAETVVVCLDGQLAEERRKVAALEQIAGPYRDSSDEPSPIYTEVTQDIPLPDGEATINLPVMHLSAKAALV